MKIKEHIEYYAVVGLLAFSRLLSKRALFSLTHWILKRFYPPESSRYCRIEEHIHIAFSEKTKEQRAWLVKEYLKHKASFYTEVILMITDRIDYEKSVINPKEAREKIEKIKKNSERGVIFLVSHYGNWEFLAQFFAINGMPGVLVAKEHKKNALIYKNIIDPYRKSFGHKVIERKGALRSIVRILKSGGGVGMHIDQMIPPPNGVLINFFGKRAYASKSMAQLKLTLDPLMVPIFAQRIELGKFRIHILEPIEYKAKELCEKGEKIEAITQHYTEILEDKILQEPSQWEWSYKRWRMPKGDKQLNKKIYSIC